MKGRRKKDDSSKVLALFLTLIIVVIANAFVITIVAIAWIINFIYSLFVNYQNKNEKVVKINDVPTVKSDENIAPKHNVNYIETPYDYKFSRIIIERGKNYFLEGKVQRYHFDGKTCSASVVGTETYKTCITFEKDEVKSMFCSCPYFEKDNKNCKHLYALLLTYGKEEQKESFEFQKITLEKDIQSSIDDLLNDIEELMDTVDDLYYEYKNNDEISEYFILIFDLKDEIDEYVSEYYMNPFTKYSMLLNDYHQLQDLYELLYDDLDTNIDFNDLNKIDKLHNYSFCDFRQVTASSKKEVSKEERLINNKEYDSFNFEEEELEEDDYFFGDDDK